MKPLACVVGIALAVVLGGCGDKPKPLSPDPVGETPAASSEPLQVVNFNQRSARAGMPFNVQADGNSGISFELNRSVSGAKVAAFFDGKQLTGVASNATVVTATIPVDYLKTPGEYPLELEVSTERARLPVGTFTVEAP